MPLPHRAREWVAGNKFSASHLNESVTRTNALWPLTGTGGINVVSGAAGSVIFGPQKAPPALGVFPAKLVQDGGDAGSDGVECTFTYTIKNLSGTQTVATGISLIGARPALVAMNAANWGLVCKNQNNDWKIFWCDEQMQSGSCDTP